MQTEKKPTPPKWIAGSGPGHRLSTGDDRLMSEPKGTARPKGRQALVVTVTARGQGEVAHG